VKPDEVFSAAANLLKAAQKHAAGTTGRQVRP